jgi:hypothetical protein
VELMGVVNDAMIEEEYHNDIALGQGMLKNFIEWERAGNLGMKILATEVEFELPIPVPDGTPVPEPFYMEDGNLHLDGEPVLYQGRVDAIGLDQQANHFIIDWKTTSQFGETVFLFKDTQVSSYAWALNQLGWDIKGIGYVQLKKNYPRAPKVLKSGRLSKDKSQPTTYEKYKRAIVEGRHNPADYQDILSHLASQDDPFIRYVPLWRTPEQLDQQHVGERGLARAGKAGEEHREPLPRPRRVGAPQLGDDLGVGEPLGDLPPVGQPLAQLGA